MRTVEQILAEINELSAFASGRLQAHIKDSGQGTYMVGMQRGYMNALDELKEWIEEDMFKPEPDEVG